MQQTKLTAEEVICAGRRPGRYRCFNCGETFALWKLGKRTDRTRPTLAKHLRSNPRCSKAIRAFNETGNVDHLENPPRWGDVQKEPL